MAKTKKLKESTTPSDDVIAQAVADGHALIAGGGSQGGSRDGDLPPPTGFTAGCCLRCLH